MMRILGSGLLFVFWSISTICYAADPVMLEYRGSSTQSTLTEQINVLSHSDHLHIIQISKNQFSWKRGDNWHLVHLSGPTVEISNEELSGILTELPRGYFRFRTYPASSQILSDPDFAMIKSFFQKAKPELKISIANFSHEENPRWLRRFLPKEHPGFMAATLFPMMAGTWAAIIPGMFFGVPFKPSGVGFFYSGLALALLWNVYDFAPSKNQLENGHPLKFIPRTPVQTAMRAARTFTLTSAGLACSLYLANLVR